MYVQGKEIVTLQDFIDVCLDDYKARYGRHPEYPLPPSMCNIMRLHINMLRDSWIPVPLEYMKQLDELQSSLSIKVYELEVHSGELFSYTYAYLYSAITNGKPWGMLLVEDREQVLSACVEILRDWDNHGKILSEINTRPEFAKFWNT